MNWQAVFFDFDGVIVDSVSVKSDAYASMFRVYGPEVERRVVAYHHAHGGVSRFVKLRYFYGVFLNTPINDAQLQVLARVFSDRVVSGVIEAPLLSGALESLKKLNRHGVPAFVVSGTPQEELVDIVKRRHLAPWFKGVCGSPTEKRELINGIVTRHSLDPSACLMVGDATTDWDAARETGTHFLGIVQWGQESPFPPGTQVSSVVSIPEREVFL